MLFKTHISLKRPFCHNKMYLCTDFYSNHCRIVSDWRFTNDVTWAITWYTQMWQAFIDFDHIIVIVGGWDRNGMTVGVPLCVSVWYKALKGNKKMSKWSDLSRLIWMPVNGCHYNISSILMFPQIVVSDLHIVECNEVQWRFGMKRRIILREFQKWYRLIR